MQGILLHVLNVMFPYHGSTTKFVKVKLARREHVIVIVLRHFAYYS